MKLIIDTRNGIAGDIVNAGLIGLGASEKHMVSSMEFAGNHIGITKIKPIYDNNAIKLEIRIETDYDHLHESRAKGLLAEIISDLKMGNVYGSFATRILDTLCNAERHVHSTDERLRHMLHHHNHGKHNTEAVLHEAKDILIDIVGFSIGLRELGINGIGYLDHVNVGNGTINFSHGVFEVPAPATEYVLNKYDISWKKSDTNEEMATPTGACILAGCNAKRIDAFEDCRIIKKTLTQGTKNLPPISFYLIE
ncbi:MAG: DUF111 family protein [Nanoarchaeota archaeon]|nr:DUF111 family protein [Nanoarchaeota archaeon]